MKIDRTDFEKQNRDILQKFINDAEGYEDDSINCLITTMTQFMVNVRKVLGQYQRDWVTTEEIIDAQVQELRRCVVDLTASKERLLKGVTKQ